MMEQNRKFTLKKMWIHLRTIITHKWYVFIFMAKCGFPLQGLIHDNSKFSPTEFFANVKYTEPGVSPISIQRKEIGYSLSWMHHKGHNPHHYVFWMDNFDDGCYVHRMPFRYMVELMCDYLGANKAYNGNKSGSYTSEYEWWRKQREIQNMHPDCTYFLDIIFKLLYDIEKGGRYKSKNSIFMNFNDVLNKKFLKEIYNEIIESSHYDQCVKIRQPKEIE